MTTTTTTMEENDFNNDTTMLMMTIIIGISGVLYSFLINFYSNADDAAAVAVALVLFSTASNNPHFFTHI